MKSLVELLVKAVVDHPDDVAIAEAFDGVGYRYEIQVHADDIGKVIGKQGRVIRAIRTVVYSAAQRAGEKVQVEINA